jgi:hypothetical protein
MDPSNKSARIPVTAPNFCSQCGQALGARLEAHATTASAFCCHCGAALDPLGKCPNTACKFSGYPPHCSDGVELA